MIRDVPFYVVQFLCCSALVVLSYLFYPHQLEQAKNLELSNATIKYITIIVLNGLMIIKMLTEFFDKPTRELWATMFLRNITSLFGISIGMIAIGNTYISCDFCELFLISIPSIALLSDIFNNNEDLLATRGTTFQNWTRPAKLENYWTMLFLYVLNMSILGWAFISYYLYNTDENKKIFEDKYLLIYIVSMSVILMKFIIFVIGRCFTTPRDYELLSNEAEATINVATSLNAPLLSYIFDISILGFISFLYGMLEILPRSYNDKEYLIAMVEVSVVLSIIKILIGKNKV